MIIWRTRNALSGTFGFECLVPRTRARVLRGTQNYECRLSKEASPSVTGLGARDA